MNSGASLPEGPLVAWYGDDFTGSAAVMEVLTFSGYPSVMFFDIPTQEQLSRFSNCRGIGVAGVSRSKGPAWMNRHLPAVFTFLENTRAPVRHYKTCSTLDSAPHVGSIGHALDLAVPMDQWAPVVMAAPDIGRYQAFGHLFAQAGATVYRLDRHPTMSAHPVTPMSEADVGRHLERQTERRAGLVDLVSIKQGRASEQLSRQIKAGHQMITFDVIDQETLAAVGNEIWQRAADGLFVIGSQGVEYALIEAWRDNESEPENTAPTAAAAVDQIAVVSGSCSPITEEQIGIAEKNGFALITLDASAAIDVEDWSRECGKSTDAAASHLADGRSPLVCTARGPQDPSLARFNDAAAQSGIPKDELNERIGVGLGRILRETFARTGISRGAIAGGDSSSHGAQQLGLYAVTAKAPIAPGASLLTGHSDDTETDGLEVALKGGQMGTPDYFLKLRDGCA